MEDSGSVKLIDSDPANLLPAKAYLPLPGLANNLQDMGFLELLFCYVSFLCPCYFFSQTQISDLQCGDGVQGPRRTQGG